MYGDLIELLQSIERRWKSDCNYDKRDFILEMINICYENALFINGIQPGISLSAKFSFLSFSDTLQNILHSKRFKSNKCHHVQNTIETLINLYKASPPFIIIKTEKGIENLTESSFKKEDVLSGKYRHILSKFPWFASNVKERPPDLLNIFLSRSMNSFNYLNIHFHIFHFSNKTSSIDRNSTSAPILSHSMYENSFRQFKKFTSSGHLNNDILGSIVCDIPLKCGVNNNLAICMKNE